MSPALHLLEHGQYDATWEVTVGDDGAYTVVGGTYVARRRDGRLTAAQREALGRSLGALAPCTHPCPCGAEGFDRTLRWGGRTLCWHGPPPDDAHLRTVLAVLHAL